MKKIEIEKHWIISLNIAKIRMLFFCELYRFKDNTGNKAYRIVVETARSMKMSEILEFINDKNTFILKVEEESN